MLVAALLLAGLLAEVGLRAHQAWTLRSLGAVGTIHRASEDFCNLPPKVDIDADWLTIDKGFIRREVLVAHHDEGGFGGVLGKDRGNRHHPEHLYEEKQ